MKIVDFVREQCRCKACIHGQFIEPLHAKNEMWCSIRAIVQALFIGETCGAWYLELTTPPNPELIGDKPHTVVYVHDFGSWLNLYQCAAPPKIRVLSRDEWPEVPE